MALSPEYLEFVQEEQSGKKLNGYEKFCSAAEKILPINPWKSLNASYQDAINFAHIKINPHGAFASTILVTLLILLVPTIISIIFGFFSFSTLILILVFSILGFYFFYQNPTHQAVVFRIKASSEMFLAIIYMSISMRISANMENAVQFASKNLKGPLAYDLRRLLWEVYTRRYSSLSDGLDEFIRKWKKENEEFTQAIYLIKNASNESTSDLERVLDESVSVMLNGTKDRMKKYAQELKTPVTAINSLGILLPVIGLVFLPIMSIFLPNVIQPIFLTVGYVILLPSVVYFLMKNYLDKRPYTFHQPDLSLSPKFRDRKFFNKYFVVAVAVGVFLVGLGSYEVLTSTDTFSFNLLAFSTLITVGISSVIILYTILDSLSKMKLRSDIVQIENEFAEALFQLGNQLKRGIPLESALNDVLPRVQELKIAKFFEVIVMNMRTFGMTFEQAVFDERSGAIHQYPSSLIATISHAIVEVSKRGMDVVSKTMISVSTYLKDVRDVENDLQDMLSETTSTMQIQSVLLAPLASGIVVALTAVVTQLLLVLKDAITKIEGQIASYGGPSGQVGGFVFGNLIQLNKTIPVQQFQLVVGLYMIEVVGMLSIFLSVIQNGDEQILRNYILGKQLLIAMAIYVVCSLLFYLSFISLVPLAGLVGAT